METAQGNKGPIEQPFGLLALTDQRGHTSALKASVAAMPYSDSGIPLR
jgi:hypothetical protein